MKAEAIRAITERDAAGRIVGVKASEMPYWDHHWLVREYVDSRRTVTSIARQFGVRHSSVLKAMKKLGVERRGPKEYPGPRRPPNAGICNGCGCSIGPDRVGKSGSRCKPCARKKMQAWKASNPDRYKASSWRCHLKKQYGMTPEEYEAMAASQGRQCAICGDGWGDSRGFRPHVDHCHKTGRVRGILCGKCNKAIGMMGDDAAVLFKAYEYLARSEQ